tara:strand:- start:2891 stop:3082 length:192 start_codon:yes stop_codon:yes gene_type:complete
MPYGSSAPPPKMNKPTAEDKLKQKMKEHSKHHTPKHMRLMRKYMKEGMSFTKAHNKVKKEVGD